MKGPVTPAPASPHAGPAPQRALRAPVWTARLALAFVFAALAVLATAPAVIQREVEPARRQVEGVEHARTQVTLAQYALAREMAALWGLSAAGGSAAEGAPELRRGYGEARGREEEAYARLDSVARGLGPEVARRARELRARSEAWHAEVEADRALRMEAGEEARLPRVETEQALYDRALDAAQALDAALVEAGRHHREEIGRAERVRMWVTLLLGALALAAAGVVGWFGHRVEALARAAAERQEMAERALAETRRLDEVRERMIRGVTHDLKNPLGAADGYAELLEMGLEEALKPGQARMVEGIRRSIHGALAIIRDLLELSRAETGALPVHRARVDLAALLREAAEDWRGAAAAAGLALEMEIAEELPAVHTDATRVRQVVGNLLSNAVKYTPAPGRVALRARAGEDGARPGRWAEVRVSDTGPGIPPEERERVFLEFHRLHDGAVEGHGLGLAVSRRIARLLGGDLAVEAAEGGGAVFSLRLPLREEGEP